jgi:hypothetical protein
MSDQVTAVFNRIIILDDTLPNLCEFVTHFNLDAATDTISLTAK